MFKKGLYDISARTIEVKKQIILYSDIHGNNMSKKSGVKVTESIRIGEPRELLFGVPKYLAKK